MIRVTREFAKQMRDWMGNATDALQGLPHRAPSSPARKPEIAAWEPWNEARDRPARMTVRTKLRPRREPHRGDVRVASTRARSLPGEERASRLPPPMEELDVEARRRRAPVVLGKLAFLTPIGAPLDPGSTTVPSDTGSRPPCRNASRDAVNAVRTGSAPIALVDLTKDPTAPDFAGWNHKGPVVSREHGQADSHARGLPAPIRPEGHPRPPWAARPPRRTCSSRRENGGSRRRRLPSGAPVVAVSGDLGRQGDLATWKGKPIALPANSSLPNLETIFGAEAGFPFKSTPYGLPGVAGCAECNEFVILERIERFGDGGDRTHGFLQRQKLMIGFSNNSAATSCIADIGFPYIASVLMQTGLWDAARGGGLWLGEGYGGPAWRASLLGGGRSPRRPARWRPC